METDSEIKTDNLTADKVSGLLNCYIAPTRVEVIGDCTLYLGDCFEIMPDLQPFDLILTDPPYGVTCNDWDVALDFSRFWPLIEPLMNGACIMTATEPFSAEAIVSNKKLFRYDLIWEKSIATGFLNAKKMPLRGHEQVLIFYKKLPTYNPQKHFLKTPSFKKAVKSGTQSRLSSNYGKFDSNIQHGNSDGSRYPRSVFHVEVEAAFFDSSKAGLTKHPTQKPLNLMSYLAATYSNLGDSVFDPFMGSGTTGVACVNSGLKFVGIEQDETYFNSAYDRIKEAVKIKPSRFF